MEKSRQFKTYSRSCPMCGEQFDSTVKPTKSLPASGPGSLVCDKPECVSGRNDQVATQNDASIRNRRPAREKTQTPLYGDMATVAMLNGLDRWGKPRAK